MEILGSPKLRTFRSDWRKCLDRPGIPELVLVLLTLSVYARSLTMGFVYDDHEMIDNPWSLHWKDVPKLFTQDLIGNHRSNFYRPLALLWQAFVHAIAGGNPVAWHSSAILLHILCVVLVFRLACNLLQESDRGYATLAAAVFAIHPTHVEVVTWISDSADLLMTAILLFAALALFHWLQSGSPIWWTASCLLGTACCFVKEIGIFAPILLLVLALSVKAKVSRPAIILTGFSLLLSSCGFLILRSQVLHGFAHPLSGVGNRDMVLTLPGALWFYLSHLIFPVSLGPFYPLAFVSDPRSAPFLMPLLLLALIVAVGWVLFCRLSDRRLFWFCVVWTIAPLIAPLYLKLFPDFELVHDRYLYLPTIALGVALAAGVKKIREMISTDTNRRCAATILTIATATLFTAAGAETISYEGVWRDDVHLFQRGVALTPRNDRALVNLGVAELQSGNVQEGSALLARSLEIQPNNAFALFDLGNVAWNNSDATAAEYYVQKALALKSHSNWWVILANAKFRLGKMEDAQRSARQALAMNPAEPGAHVLLGAVSLQEGDSATAVREISEELVLYPANVSAREALKVAQTQFGSQQEQAPR